MSEDNAYIIPTQVEEINFLTNTEAVLKIKRAPHLNYFTQSIPIPGISAPPMSIANPHASIRLEGNKPIFDPLNITFKIDQQMNNYMELLSWMYGLSKPRDYEDAKVFDSGTSAVDVGKLPKYSDGSVFILSNGKRPTYEIRYTKLVPVAISIVPFDTTQRDNTYAQATASFVYDLFEVYRVSDNIRLA